MSETKVIGWDVGSEQSRTVIEFRGRDSSADMEVFLTLHDDGTWTSPPGGLQKFLSAFDTGIRVQRAIGRYTVPPGEDVAYQAAERYEEGN